MGSIWDIVLREDGATFWVEAGKRYVACRCGPDALRRVERKTGLTGAAALRAVQDELIAEASRRLADQEPLPLKIEYHD
jgi:hypothetical protein